MGSKMWKFILQKIVANFLDKLRKLFLNGTLEIFSFIQAYKIQGDIFFTKQIYFTEKSRCVPLS